MVLPETVTARARSEVRSVIVSQRRDWTSVIGRLNKSAAGYMRIRMGSPGSAQVTRCRLLEQWDNIEIWTDGAVLHMRLAGA